MLGNMRSTRTDVFCYLIVAILALPTFSRAGEYHFVLYHCHRLASFLRREPRRVKAREKGKGRERERESPCRKVCTSVGLADRLAGKLKPTKLPRPSEAPESPQLGYNGLLPFFLSLSLALPLFRLCLSLTLSLSLSLRLSLSPSSSRRSAVLSFSPCDARPSPTRNLCFEREKRSRGALFARSTRESGSISDDDNDDA